MTDILSLQENIQMFLFIFQINFYQINFFGRTDGHSFISLDQSLVPSHSLRDKGTKGQRDKGTKGQRDKGTKGQRDKETKGQRDKGTRDKGTKGPKTKGQQRNIGTKGQHRNKGTTQEQRNK